MASRRAWLALTLTVTVTGGGIWFVHDAQVQERAALHAGVLRDAELLRAKRAERAGRGGGGGTTAAAGGDLTARTDRTV